MSTDTLALHTSQWSQIRTTVARFLPNQMLRILLLIALLLALIAAFALLAVALFPTNAHALTPLTVVPRPWGCGSTSGPC